MATASTKKSTTAAVVTGGTKLKAPSKGVAAVGNIAKKTSKPVKAGIPRLTKSPMAATDSRHLALSPHRFPVKLSPHEFEDIDGCGGGGETQSGQTTASPTDAVTNECMGNLVCVNGKHIGVLRYFGTTHFEDGLWCGVEFSEALGKNDGSVMGFRYFTCKDKHGIFAPLSIVTKVRNAPSLATSLVGASVINSGMQSSECHNPVDLNNRPKGLPITSTMCSKPRLPLNQEPASEVAPVAPATTPVSEDAGYLTSASAPLFGIKRLKKESKRERGKDSHHRVNQQQKKKRKLDSGQKQNWSDNGGSGADDEDARTTISTKNNDAIMRTPTSQQPTPESLGSQDIDLPNLLTVKLKDKILGAGFYNSPLFSPPATYGESFASRLVSSTPSNYELRGHMSRMERLRLERYGSTGGTPKSSRIGVAKLSTPEDPVDYNEKDWMHSRAESPLAANFDLERNPLPEEAAFDPPQSLGAENKQSGWERKSEEDDQADDGDARLSSPVSSTTREDTGPEGVINLEAFPAKRPSSISLAHQGFSSEESSELGIFGVSTPELIGGDGTSLALSIPTSCCSSPGILEDNDNEFGLMTPSHLQDCWNSNTNDDDIYQHLRSPSVDDLEEFEEESKLVDQDLSNPCGIVPATPFMGRMTSSLHGTLVLNENDGLTTIHHQFPMHHSLNEGVMIQHPSQGRVRRDRTYTQLPTVPNLNQQQQEESQLQNRQQQQAQTHSHHAHPQQQHAPLSFRESGSGSGSGYCASDPFTDSDFNTESEADHDHDECSSSAPVSNATSAVGGSGNHTNSCNLKNRSARVIDGALYTSHPHQHGNVDRASPSLHHQPNHNNHQPQSQHNFIPNRQENTNSSASVTDSTTSVGKSIDMISSSISVSVSSNSASACASEMESSGFYSDASERNPSGGSAMSESDHVYGHQHGHRRSSRHLSKSSSDCDDSSVALSMGIKMTPLKPLTQSEDDDSVQILSASSICNDDDDEVEEGVDEMSSFELVSSFNETMLAVNETKDLEKHTSSSSTSTVEPEGSPNKVAIVKTNPPIVEYQSDPNQLRKSHTNGSPDQQVPCIDEDMMLYYEEDMDVDMFAEYENNDDNEKMYESYDVSREIDTKQNTQSISGIHNRQDDTDMADMDLDLELAKSLNTNCRVSSQPSPSTDTHGSLYEAGGNPQVESAADGLGASGSFSCFRSQSANCIASLTSSTSSASTVTTKSCVTAGTGLASTKSKSSKSGKKGGNSGASIASSTSSSSSTRDKVQNAESKSSKPSVLSKSESTASTEEQLGESGNVTSTKSESTGNVASSSGSVDSGRNTTAVAGSSSASSNVPAEQSSVGSSTTSGGNSTTTNRRTSRMSTAKSSTTAGGARKGTTVSSGASNASNSRANISNTSTISNSIDLNRTNRSTVSNTSKVSGHGSTRSLASVGLAPSSASTSASNKSSCAAAKKLNKWDAVMSKIAENQHKTINVKDVKSKVFNSVKPGSVSSSAGTGHGSATSASSNGAGGKMVKGAKSGSRVTLADRGNENDPLVPPAVHRRQHNFSSRSSTVSDSSLDEHQPQRGPPPAKHHRAKKDASINRRQVSDLSSASDYSATTQSQPASSSNSGKNTTNTKAMTTGGARRAQRGGTSAASSNAGANSTGTQGAKTSTASATGSGAAAKSHGTKNAQSSEVTVKKKGVASNQSSSTRGVTAKSKVGSSTVSSHQNDNPSTKSHPAVKPLRDRNRLGPVGKNYGSSALDANANESEAPILRGQAIGELDPSAKSCTKVSGTTEPLLADPSANNNTSNHLIISKNKSSAHNNRVSSHNQHNAQNSVLVQENSSLKEEVSRLSSVVSDLQEQISRLTTSGEETKKTLEGCVAEADTRCLAFSIVTQQFDQKRTKLEEQLAKQQAENEEWKQRLEEKLAELQKLQLAYEKEKEEHIEEFVKVTSRHELEIDVTVKNCENKLVQLQKRHDETLAELKRSHNEELERLQEAQRQELEQTIQKHRELLDQHRNQSPHDILHKEVESLQVVVEMRNEEIRVLRKDLMDYKNTLNDLQVAREHGKSLLAKIEDLEAQLEKGRADKRDLQERYQRLETNLQQAESENSRLVRCNEELKWKMKSCDIVED